jgi:MFS family permease
VTIIAMAVSAACCLLTAIFFQHFSLVLALAMVWGIAVIADSAQFSAIISEVADRRYVGTALTMQTALGFLLTAGSIRLTAYISEHAGWRWAAASLAIGPLLGIWAMLTLMRRPGFVPSEKGGPHPGST